LSLKHPLRQLLKSTVRAAAVAGAVLLLLLLLLLVLLLILKLLLMVSTLAVLLVLLVKAASTSLHRVIKVWSTSLSEVEPVLHASTFIMSMPHDTNSDASCSSYPSLIGESPLHAFLIVSKGVVLCVVGGGRDRGPERIKLIFNKEGMVTRRGCSAVKEGDKQKSRGIASATEKKAAH